MKHNCVRRPRYSEQSNSNYRIYKAEERKRKYNQGIMACPFCGQKMTRIELKNHLIESHGAV